MLSLPDNTAEAQEFRDRNTGLRLNPEMMKRARELEMQYMDELKVLEDSDRDACMAETGRPPIPTDWVDINKGGALRPNYRSRLVCQAEDWGATFAATTPYEAFRLQLSLPMTGPRSESQGNRASSFTAVCRVLALDMPRGVQIGANTACLCSWSGRCAGVTKAMQ